MTDKVALMSGGPPGLGLYMAHGLAEMGANVAIAARKEPELLTARTELQAAGTRVGAVQHDLSNIGAMGISSTKSSQDLGTSIF